MKKIFFGVACLAMLTLSCSSDDSSTDNSMAKAATLSGGPFEFEVGDGEAEFIDIAVVNPGAGSNSEFLITDSEYKIIDIASSESALEAVNFDVLRDGNAYVWHLNYEDGIYGNAIDENLNNIAGDFRLSNKIEVVKNGPQSATIETDGSYRFCVDNGTSNFVTDVIFSEDEDSGELLVGRGEKSSFVITDLDLNILYTPETFTDLAALDFNEIAEEDVVREELGALEDVEDEDVFFEVEGVNEAKSRDWLLWHVNYIGDLVFENPLRPNAGEILNGNEALSNSITIRRDLPDGGTIKGGTADVFDITINDESNFVTGIEFTDDTVLAGPSRSWIITDDATGEILGLPKTLADLEAVDFNAAGVGTCLIWHISYVGTYTTIAAAVGGNTSDLEGCYDLSNPITVNRTAAP